MVISQSGINLIKSFEGKSLTAYWDSTGKVWTIGYGHTGADVYDGLTITEEQAENLLRSDCQWAQDAVNTKVTAALNQNQFDALTSFTFNVGSGAFGSSTLLKLLNQNNYQGAADEFPKWIYSGGVVLQGLVNRRNQERELFLNGVITPVAVDKSYVRNLQALLNAIGAKDNNGNALVVDGWQGDRTNQAIANAKNILQNILG